ncbi:MAG: HD-GYP domain-containing protein [Streptosporangiaceae bacterium]
MPNARSRCPAARGLPRAAQAYIVLVVAVALAALARAATVEVPWLTVGALALVFWMAESWSTQLRTTRVTVSISCAASLAAAVLVGPVGAALVAATGVATLHPGGWAPIKRAFNGAQFALAGYAGGMAYILAGGTRGPLTTGDLPLALGAFAAAMVAGWLVNTGLVAVVVKLAEGGRARAIGTAVANGALSYLGYAVFGLLIAALWGLIGAFAALLVLLPVAVARWAFSQRDAEQEAYDRTIAALSQAVETKDYYTRGHGDRVGRAVVMIARKLGMSEERVAALHYAGMLHDVGKLGVPTKVLQKDGPLSEEEFAAIQLHPMRGLEVVREIDFLDEARAGIMHHHERIDGTGYPMGLSGDAIPEFARVIGVADAFDSMTSTRSYRSARTVEEAIGELRRFAGKQFDSTMVGALVRAVAEQGWKTHQVRPGAAEAVLPLPSHDHDDPSTPLRVAEGGRPRR